VNELAQSYISDWRLLVID